MLSDAFKDGKNNVVLRITRIIIKAGLTVFCGLAFLLVLMVPASAEITGSELRERLKTGIS